MSQVVTNAGEALFAHKAQANEQLDIDTFIFAYVPGQDSQAPVDRSEGLPPTAQQVHTQTVQQVGRINNNTVVYSTVLNSLTGPFEFNWVGLYSSVNNTLVAISHVKSVNKTITELGNAGNTLNRNFAIEYSGISDITGITVAPETWQLDFSARLAGMDALTQNLVMDMNGRDWFIGDGFKVEPTANDDEFRVIAGVGYVHGMRVELERDYVFSVQSYPQNVYVDVWFDGDANGKWRALNKVALSEGVIEDYFDNGQKHTLLNIAIVYSLDITDDFRNIEGFEKRIIDHEIDGEHDANKIIYKNSTVENELDAIIEKQNWADNIKNIKNKNDVEVLYRKQKNSNEDFNIYINHQRNGYQSWNLTRGPNGFDNNVATHENGNMWMINDIRSTLIGPVDSVLGSSDNMLKTGDWVIYGDVATGTGGKVETHVKGTDIFIKYIGKSDAGIANVFVDGDLVKEIDMYTSSTAGQAIGVAIIRGLQDVEHFVELHFTGRKNENSSSNIVRIGEILAVGLQDYQNIEQSNVFSNPMNNGSSNFKIPRAACEIALNTTHEGNSEWGGSYHKNCYPRQRGNEKIFIDGILKSYEDLENQKLYVAKKIMIIQELALNNNGLEYADLNMVHIFDSNGCTVKWSLKWKAEVIVNRFYQSMWPCEADTIMFGNTQHKYKAKLDNQNIFLSGMKTHNAICWNSSNNWISGVRSNNEEAMKFESDDNSYYGMYAWDRPSDFKLYMRKFKGLSKVGEVINSDVSYFFFPLDYIDHILDYESY